jgi:hypothetical protein
MPTALSAYLYGIFLSVLASASNVQVGLQADPPPTIRPHGPPLLLEARRRLDGAAIVNSGSTNVPGWRVLIRSNGRGIVLPEMRRFRIERDAALTFLHDARDGKFQQLAAPPCAKSISFGTRLNVLYHGWSSPDLSCQAASGLQAKLARDVRSIVAVAQPPSGLHRIHVPIEPRRVPTNPPGYAPSGAQVR